MPAVVPPLAFFCIHVLARFPDQLHHIHHRRVPASPALLDAFDARDPCLWAALAQVVHPLPLDYHDHDLALSHHALPLLQKIPDSPDFSLVTLVSLANCTHVRDNDVADLRFLHRLLALDLRGCAVSSYALTALARGVAARSGVCGLRLLGLHGCPNVDDDVLAPLTKFPLLSAVDLRFTRCTSAAVNARLYSLGFHPSDNNALFHPAPLALALCSLEKIASASDPISLYSCPPQSVFRLHVDRHTEKIAPVPRSRSTIRAISSAEDTVVFMPPPRKQSKCGPVKPSVSVTPTHSPPSQLTSPNPDSNVSSFYDNTPAHFRNNTLPLSAQAVQSHEGPKLDPLAIARSPPSWNVLDASNSPDSPLTIACRRTAPASSRRVEPAACWIGQALNNPLKVDRARLHKRGSDAVADMVHQFACKRSKVESEFALAKTRAKLSVKSRNPFVKDVRSVFAESRADTFDNPRAPVSNPPKGLEPEVQLRACRSLPSMGAHEEGTSVNAISNKPLKPITSLKPPVLPKEYLPSMPPRTSHPRTNLKQTRLSFAREVE